MPTRSLQAGICAVCGNKLLVNENEEGIIENTYKLTCQHEYVPFIYLFLINKKRVIYFLDFMNFV